MPKAKTLFILEGLAKGKDAALGPHNWNHFPAEEERPEAPVTMITLGVDIRSSFSLLPGGEG